MGDTSQLFGGSVPIPVEVFALGLGAIAFGFLRWVEAIFASLKERHAKVEERIDRADDDTAEGAVAIARAIATMAAEIKEHGRRIGELELWKSDAEHAVGSVREQAAVNGSRAETAVLELVEVRADIRGLQRDFAGFGQKLNHHDERQREAAQSQRETAQKLDRIYSVFMRAAAESERRLAGV